MFIYTTGSYIADAHRGSVCLTDEKHLWICSEVDLGMQHTHRHTQNVTKHDMSGYTFVSFKLTTSPSTACHLSLAATNTELT